MKLLTESQAVDIWVVYQFIKKLTTDFKDTQAFRLGIIDASGNVLRKRNTLKTIEEKNAYTVFDGMIFKIKRLIEKLPGGKTHLASFSAALWLIKENRNLSYYEENQQSFEDDFNIFLKQYSPSRREEKMLKEVYKMVEGDNVLNEAFNKLTR